MVRAAAMVLLLLAAGLAAAAGPEWRQPADGTSAAQRTLDRALRLAPDDPARARALLQRGLEQQPGHHGLRLALVRMQLQQGRAGPVRRLLAAGRSWPMPAGVARRYARFYLLLGEVTTARAILRAQRRRTPSRRAVAAAWRQSADRLALWLLRERAQQQRLETELQRRIPAGVADPTPEAP